MQTLTVSGLPSELGVGERAQMVARAGWSDGRSEDVTARARWTSRSLACLITSAGTVTATDVGDCSIDGSFEARTASATGHVTPARTFTISGVVREKYELREPPIPGATVTITSGPQAGRTTTADQLGRFTLDGVPRGTVMLRIQAEAFDAVTLQLSPDSPALDAFLPPEMVTLTYDSRTGGIAPPNAGRFAVPFRTSHRGYVTLSVYSSKYECGTYETLTGWVRDSTVAPESLAIGDLVISPCHSYQTGVPEVKSVPLPAGNYEFRMFQLFPEPDNINILSVTHPR